MAQAQGETFGRYTLLKVLARGGMGEVHLARLGGMEGFEKLCVIKRILPHLAEDEEFVNMFLDEARIAARLSHPNIVSIFDFGRVDDYYYLAMDFIHGDDIRRIWKKTGQLNRKIPPALACRMIADAAAGLDFAHKKHDEKGEPMHIVHRDISPHNIIVTFDGGVKVIDFGIARARGRMTHTATGAIKGRFEYMSPEHAAGQDVDHRSDIFALGVVLWETLSGVRLFKRDSETQTLMAVADCKVEPPSKYNPDVDPALDAVVLKALAQQRENRYPDAMAFRLALEDWIVGARQSASSAHLAAFMAEVYADRLATESKLGHPVVEESTNSNLSKGAADGTKKAQKLDIVPPTNPGQTASSAPTIVPGKSRTVPFVIGAVAAAVLALIGFVATRPAPVPAAASAPVPAPVAAVEPPAAPPVVAAPAPAPPPVVPVAPADVLVSFMSDPPGADVLVEGMPIGKTPLQWRLPRAEAPAKVELKLAGYRKFEQSLVTLENGNVVAKLEKIPQKQPEKQPDVPAPFDIKIGR